jgi:hypothetical protein
VTKACLILHCPQREKFKQYNIRGPFVDLLSISHIFTKNKINQGQHAPQVNSWHTASRKVSGKINHKMTKSVFKDTQKVQG